MHFRVHVSFYPRHGDHYLPPGESFPGGERLSKRHSGNKNHNGNPVHRDALCLPQMELYDQTALGEYLMFLKCGLILLQALRCFSAWVSRGIWFAESTFSFIHYSHSTAQCGLPDHFHSEVFGPQKAEYDHDLRQGSRPDRGSGLFYRHAAGGAAPAGWAGAGKGRGTACFGGGQGGNPDPGRGDGESGG